MTNNNTTDLVQRYGNLAERLRIYKNDPTRKNEDYLWDGFGLIHNRIQTITETLGFYYERWAKFLQENPTIQDETIKKEIFGRITTLTTWGFVSIFSAIEFVMKQIVKDTKMEEFSEIKLDLQNEKRVYLDDIIKKSLEPSLVDRDELATWIALIKLRNIFVHNNGFPDSDKLYEPVKKYFTVFQKNQMTMSPYDIFYTFTEMIIDLYESWSQNYRKHYS